MGGGNVVADGRTTPLVVLAPIAICPHSSQQDRFAKIGPDCCVDRTFLQQHLPWVRQQEGVGSLNALAAIGATEAKSNKNAVHAATGLRSRKICCCPSIPGKSLYHARGTNQELIQHFPKCSTIGATIMANPAQMLSA